VILCADGRHQFGGQWPPQLFHMKEDPWELHDIAAANPAIVARLTALLETVMDPQAIVSPSLVLLREVLVATLVLGPCWLDPVSNPQPRFGWSDRGLRYNM